MPERICKAPFEYAGAPRAPGEKVEVEPQHVLMLVASGHIEREASDEAPAYVSRDMAAGWPGNYQTRAMTAPSQKRTSRRAGAAQ